MLFIGTLLTPAGDEQPPHIRHPATEGTERAGNQARSLNTKLFLSSWNNLRLFLCYQGHKINLRVNNELQPFVLSLQPPRRSLAWSHPPRSRPPVQNTVRARGQSQLELQRAVSLLPSSKWQKCVLGINVEWSTFPIFRKAVFSEIHVLWSSSITWMTKVVGYVHSFRIQSQAP